jgi:hypothetical protein
LQQRARDQAVKIAFVGENNVGFWQRFHVGGNLIQLNARGEMETRTFVALWRRHIKAWILDGLTMSGDDG